MLWHLVTCFKSAAFDLNEMIDTIASTFQRLSQQGFEKGMPKIWKAVQKCVEMEVPETMDCAVQHFRGFGSHNLHRFTDEKAPPEVGMSDVSI